MHADGDEAEEDEEGESDRPKKRRDAAVDARWPDVHCAGKLYKRARFVRDQKNSPSRFRFRPPLPLTFPLRVLPSDSVSIYSRSVLGASSKLRDARCTFKGVKEDVAAICEKFNYQHVHSISCNMWTRLWKVSAGQMPATRAPLSGR